MFKQEVDYMYQHLGLEEIHKNRKMHPLLSTEHILSKHVLCPL